MRIWLMSALVACSGVPDTDSGTEPSPTTARVALIADSHLIDAFYTCCEGSELDTESLQFSESRLLDTRAQLNALEPPPDALMVAGDIVHEFPSADPAFYEDNTTSMDRAAEIYAGFDFPAYFALGNHDYEVPALPRELTWDLVRSKWNMDRTWQAVDVGGTRWLLLDGQFGPTWDPEDTLYDRDFASFGDEQLAWVDAQLSEGLPTFLVFHHPPNFVRVNESSGAFPDLFALVASHGDTVEGIFTGHMHLWMDTSSMWERPGYGLAATRYDARNWWVMDIDLTTGDWAIPRASEVQYASFWFDGEQPEEASLRRVPKPKDLRVLADLEWARLQAEGWHCRTLRDVPGQGLAAGCAKTGQRHHVLTVTDLRGDGWVGFAPQHDHHAPHNP